VILLEIYVPEISSYLKTTVLIKAYMKQKIKCPKMHDLYPTYECVYDSRVWYITDAPQPPPAEDIDVTGNTDPCTWLILTFVCEYITCRYQMSL